MYVTAVLCPDAVAFERWCRTNGYVRAGDGAETPDGRWVAVRVLVPADLTGIRPHRIDYALDFWRRGERTAVVALDETARSLLVRPDTAAPETPGRPGPRRFRT
jgi:hypothetical protein